jgi:hypothetical protein
MSTFFQIFFSISCLRVCRADEPRDEPQPVPPDAMAKAPAPPRGFKIGSRFKQPLRAAAKLDGGTL